MTAARVLVTGTMRRRGGQGGIRAAGGPLAWPLASLRESSEAPGRPAAEE